MTDQLYQLLARIVFNSEETSAPTKEILDTISLDQLLKLAKFEKVFPDVYGFIKKIVGSLPAHEEFYQAFFRNRERYLKVLSYLGPDALVFKGYSLEHYYPIGRYRYAADLDIGISSIERFWNLAKKLFSQEHYILGTMLWTEDPFTKAIWLSGRLEMKHPPADYNGYEVQIGMFPISWCTYLPWSDFANHIILGDDSNFTKLDASAQLIFLLGEYVARDRLKLRDLYDVVRLTNNNDIDINFVSSLIKERALGRAVDILKSSFHALPEIVIPPIIEMLIEKFSPSTKITIRSLFMGHIWLYLKNRRKKSFPISALLLQIIRGITFYFNRRDKFLWLLKAIDYRFLIRPLFRSGFPIYMIHLNNQENILKWEDRKNLKILATPIGDFVASINAVLSDEELDQLTVND